MEDLEEEQREAVRVNLARYFFRLEAALRKEAGKQNNSLNDLDITASTVDRSAVQNVIVNQSIITIFMAFLTYSPKERRDFLKNDLSIEEDFKEEAENITQLGNLYRSLDEQEKNQ